MIAKLIVASGKSAGRSIAIKRNKLLIGRAEGCDVRPLSEDVSRRHCAITVGPAEVWVEDLGSRNGTLVNGVPVTRQVLLDGDCIEIGVYTLTYVAEPLLALPFERPLVAHVKRLTGQRAGQTIRIDRPKVSLRADCGSIAVIAHRRHAHHLTHVDGRGCPLINGEPIGLGSRELNDDDLIELGTCVFQFGPDHGPASD
jgi:pSer/pThr/pTyr-binding forkhead associated (FHA) protein